MSLRNVLENLSEAGVSVWLGRDGALRIDSGAPELIKALVRENKQALVDLCRAQEFVNAAGLRLVRMPMGGRGGIYAASALKRHPPGAAVPGVPWSAARAKMAHQGSQWCSPCPQNVVFLPQQMLVLMV